MDGALSCYCIDAIISPQPRRDDEANTIKTSKDERKPDRDSAMKNGSSENVEIHHNRSQTVQRSGRQARYSSK